MAHNSTYKKSTTIGQKIQMMLTKEWSGWPAINWLRITDLK